MADYIISSMAETAIMDVYTYVADSANNEYPDNKENTEQQLQTSVRNFLKALPEGQKTELEIGGKTVIVDKTGNKTIVSPQNPPSE